MIAEEKGHGAQIYLDSEVNPHRRKRRSKLIDNLRYTKRALFNKDGSSPAAATAPDFSTLSALYLVLSDEEKRFFEKLDLEVAKVDSFYREREREVQVK
jgi:hypothetical protein